MPYACHRLRDNISSLRCLAKIVVLFERVNRVIDKHGQLEDYNLLVISILRRLYNCVVGTDCGQVNFSKLYELFSFLMIKTEF